MNPRDEGLGLSLLVYLAALICGLGVVMLPIYLANRPTVIENANTRMLARSASGILAVRPTDGRFPVARLEHQTIDDPATATELEAAEKKAKPAHAAPVHLARRTSRLRPRPPADSYPAVGARHRPAYPHISAMF
jgi:hypothetical protein